MNWQSFIFFSFILVYTQLKKTRDVSTYQKLSPPKSLQGEEDAEVTWDLILNRYPNAAPLLCQMENVIERAEGLLQQLRSPYPYALEKSNSFQIADSEDELMGPCHVDEAIDVSITSGKDSRLSSAENITSETFPVSVESLSEKSSNDYNNRQENSGSKLKVCSVDAGPSENASLEGQTSSPEVSRSSIFESPSILEVEIKEDIGKADSPKSSTSAAINVVESQESSKKSLEVEKSSSLEAWGKVVGENPMETKNQKPVSSKKTPAASAIPKEDSVSEHARRLSTLKSGPMQQITKLNLLGKKEELMQRFAGTIATASKVVDTNRIMNENHEAKEAIQHEEKDYNSIEAAETEIEMNECGEKTVNSNKEKNDKKVEYTNEEKDAESLKEVKPKLEADEVQGNGDDGVNSSNSGPRSAIEILDEYSKICGIPVEYKNLSPSCSYNKNFIVKCCLGGFAFDACAQVKKIAKKEAATKLLRCLVGRQIDGENMIDLTPFNRKQIEEIISLGNGGEHETAVRKLYKMCMELNAPEPVYTVHQNLGIVGNRYTVKCVALGMTTSGFGIRVLVAKKVAADKLLHDYNAKKSTN